MSKILDNPKEFFESLSTQEFEDLLNEFGFEYKTKSNLSLNELNNYTKSILKFQEENPTILRIEVNQFTLNIIKSCYVEHLFTYKEYLKQFNNLSVDLCLNDDIKTGKIKVFLSNGKEEIIDIF